MSRTVDSVGRGFRDFVRPLESSERGTVESGIAIQLLGPIRICSASGLHAPPGAKLQRLLGVLAVNANRPIARDVLIEELDLMRTSSNAANTLHAHMVRLRRWLRSHVEERCYQLSYRPDEGYVLTMRRDRVDAVHFAALVDTAMQLPPSTPMVTSSLLEDALHLWKENSSSLERICDGPILARTYQELTQLRRVGREALVDAWLRLSAPARVLEQIREFVADDPLNERLHASRILALRLSGRDTDAIDAHRAATLLLRNELGVQPSSHLNAALRDPLSSFPRTAPPRYDYSRPNLLSR